MRLRKINDEVLYATDNIICVGNTDIDDLKILSDGNARKRVRLCAHPSPEDRLHEMLIVLGKGIYIKPHRHPGKSESFHVIEGCADIVLFDEEGTVIERIELGEYSSGRRFFFRIDRPIYHTVLVISDRFIFHETTNGPFSRSDTEYAPWAPDESDASVWDFSSWQGVMPNGDRL